MLRKTILAAITMKEIELVKNAEEEAAKILEEAEREAARIVEEAGKEPKKTEKKPDEEKLKAKAREKAGETLEGISKEKEHKIKSIEQKARKNMDKAADAIAKKVWPEAK